MPLIPPQWNPASEIIVIILMLEFSVVQSSETGYFTLTVVEKRPGRAPDRWEEREEERAGAAGRSPARPGPEHADHPQTGHTESNHVLTDSVT